MVVESLVSTTLAALPSTSLSALSSVRPTSSLITVAAKFKMGKTEKFRRHRGEIIKDKTKPKQKDIGGKIK